MGELYQLKSRRLLHESVLQDYSRFSQLPQETQQSIQGSYSSLQKDSQTSFTAKLSRSWNILAFYLSPFCQAWILFSLLIPIFILLRIEGATIVVWLLPVLALLYSWDNFSNGKDLSQSKEVILFPSEEYLVSNYLKEPLKANIPEQQKQLKTSWEKYLIQEWSGELKSLDAGQFSFNVARIEAQETDAQVSFAWHFRERESPVMLLLYFGWNLFFAFFFSRKKRRIVDATSI